MFAMETIYKQIRTFKFYKFQKRFTHKILISINSKYESKTIVVVVECFANFTHVQKHEKKKSGLQTQFPFL